MDLIALLSHYMMIVVFPSFLLLTFLPDTITEAVVETKLFDLLFHISCYVIVCYAFLEIKCAVVYAIQLQWMALKDFFRGNNREERNTFIRQSVLIFVIGMAVRSYVAYWNK